LTIEKLVEWQLPYNNPLIRQQFFHTLLQLSVSEVRGDFLLKRKAIVRLAGLQHWG